MLRYINFKNSTSQFELFSLSHYFVCLVAGVGAKLSGAVYRAPYPPGYGSKIILLILLILYHLNGVMYPL